MEPLEKLDIIVKHEIKKTKAAQERSIGRHSPIYIQDLTTKIDTLGWVWTMINAVRGNMPSVADEMIKRLYIEDGD
jgi:hypothetical protein